MSEELPTSTCKCNQHIRTITVYCAQHSGPCTPHIAGSIQPRGLRYNSKAQQEPHPVFMSADTRARVANIFVLIGQKRSQHVRSHQRLRALCQKFRAETQAHLYIPVPQGKIVKARPWRTKCMFKRALRGC